MRVKFLIIRFSSIGDIVLCSPVIRCLKEQVENAEVHFFTKPEYAKLLNENPHVDRVIALGPARQTVKDLRKEKYDYVIDLHRNLRSGQFKNKMRIIDFNVNKINLKKWLMVRFKINRLPDKHIVDRYLDTIRLFDVKNDGRGLDFFIPEKEEIPARQLPDTLHNGYVAYAIGGKHETKKMPREMIAYLCQKVNAPVALLGDQFDYDNGQWIKEHSSNAINLCGTYNLFGSASVVKHASLVISHDTGLMHIAAALKKDILSLWGNTIPEFGMYPYKAGENSRIFEVSDLRCRPCSKIGFKKCPKTHFKCMKEQDINEIAEHANTILKV